MAHVHQYPVVLDIHNPEFIYTIDLNDYFGLDPIFLTADEDRAISVTNVNSTFFDDTFLSPITFTYHQGGTQYLLIQLSGSSANQPGSFEISCNLDRNEGGQVAGFLGRIKVLVVDTNMNSVELDDRFRNIENATGNFAISYANFRNGIEEVHRLNVGDGTSNIEGDLELDGEVFVNDKIFIKGDDNALYELSIVGGELTITERE